MAKFGILVPHEEMIPVLEEVLQEEDFRSLKKEIVYQHTTQTANTVTEARNAVHCGADFLIARGYQARLIRKYTNIPLVELRLHPHELGMLIRQAKTMTGKEQPVVAMIVFENMVRDLEELESLFDVSLRMVYLKDRGEVYDALRGLNPKEVDVVIGGDAVCKEAGTLGFLSLRYGYSRVSVREALYEAERLSYAIDSEARYAAQFDALLGTASNGIIRVDEVGNIVLVNQAAERFLGKDALQAKGRSVTEICPEIDVSALTSILNGSIDHYTTTLQSRQQPWVLLITPVSYEEEITGAILSLEKITPAKQWEFKQPREMVLGGYSAETTFERILTQDPVFQAQLTLARRYALSDNPVLLLSPAGTESANVAEAIHNNSRRKPGPFLSLDVTALPEDAQEQLLFGHSLLAPAQSVSETSAVYRANYGTLFLRGIEHLNLSSQHHLLRLMMPDEFGKTDAQGIEHLSVRFLFSAPSREALLAKGAAFSSELYYLISALTVTIPPLARRGEDLSRIFDTSFHDASKRYGKYLVLTAGAKSLVQSLPWAGNQLQIKSFCERLVLSADRRSVDETLLRSLYEELFPTVQMEQGLPTIVRYQAPQADEIRALLKKHHGNRAAIAKELGISTTTLWRRMKKYGI